jgi:hypothetical protein
MAVPWALAIAAALGLALFRALGCRTSYIWPVILAQACLVDLTLDRGCRE